MVLDELHICLWGERNFSNYTPVIERGKQAGLLVLVPHDEMMQAFNALQCHNNSPLILDWPINNPDSSDFSRLDDMLAEISCGEILLNLSSGERYNAMLLLQWALKRNISTYLVDADDHLRWLNPNDMPATQVPDLAGLQEYFRVHQLRILRNGLGLRITHPLRMMVNRWVESYDDIGPFRYMNGVASSAVMSTDPAFPFTSSLNPHWQQTPIAPYLKDLAAQKLVVLDGNTLKFTSEASRSFCNGGWLELYAYEQVCRLKDRVPELQEVRIALELSYDGHLKNELDVVFLANNQLHIIEVKTSYLENKNAAANQIVYKLEALAEALGHEVKGMMVSLSELPDTAVRRAGLYELEVVAGHDLRNLDTRIRQWIRTPQA